jgi:LytR cell envelope-related transcriptional attenuator
MSNEQPSRPRKSGSSASPMGSTLAIVIAIAAVVVGFLILKNINSDDNKTTATTQPTSPPIDTSQTITSQPTVFTEPTTTIFTPVTTGASVIVANSSHQNGVAKTLSTALQGQQFTMVAPTNGSTKEAATKIQYKDGDTGALAVAQSVAKLMGVATVDVMPTPVALADPATLAEATVLILLGDDKAGKTLAQMTGAEPVTTGAGTPSSTAAP